jgi:hypothetical protein
MCYGCWEEAGKPQINTPAVREAARLAEVVYEHSCVGGNLHITLDDWNVEDSSLEFCRGSIRDNVNEGDAEQLAAELACLEAFAKLTVEERYSALALQQKMEA